jgi:hypothetical protein
VANKFKPSRLADIRLDKRRSALLGLQERKVLVENALKASRRKLARTNRASNDNLQRLDGLRALFGDEYVEAASKSSEPVTVIGDSANLRELLRESKNIGKIKNRLTAQQIKFLAQREVLLTRIRGLRDSPKRP